MKHTDSALELGSFPFASPQTFVSPLAFTGLAGARRSDQRYISRREVRKIFPVSDMTIWRWTQDPQIAFPKPVKLGRNGRNFWWLPAILEWERRRTANSPSRRDA